MGSAAQPLPLAVIALGGNALLPRGLPTTASNQLTAVRAAADLLGAIAGRTRLVVTHGSGPQVGLLSLKEDAYPSAEPYPLDVLDAESAGQIGYLVEQEIGNAVPGQDLVTILTRVLVRADDPGFAQPSKFIGPVYTEHRAKTLAEQRGWTVVADGHHWRRVVPSPDPLKIIELAAIRRLVADGFLVVCAGGGGIPVVDTPRGRVGVEAVVDKDLSTALVAIGLGADLLVLATDVDAVYTGWGTAEQQPIRAATPDALRAHRFPEGSMAPKVEAVCRFVEATGGRAAIGALTDIAGLVDGTAGTQIGAEHAPAGCSSDRAAALLG